MNEHYVTLFDSLFLPQGVALHASMERHILQYTLWVLCVDDKSYAALETLQLPNVRLLKLSNLETEELLAVKPFRSNAEYCWTLTPYAPRFVFEHDLDVSRVTYLDADLWFTDSPEPIFQEFDQSGKQVLITDHGYAPEYDQSATSGKYCVQFMIFERDRSELVRRWWEERCIEWCYRRFEDGKFGDQKYLDCWPTLFGEYVHILSRQEWSQAPWNATRFPYGQSIFYHFHGLRILEGNVVDFGPIYALPKVLVQHLYEPYIKELISAITKMKMHGIYIRYQGKKMGTIHLLRRIISGVYGQLWRFHSLNIRKY